MKRFQQKMAHKTGVEPVTYRLEGGCSIQLSYSCALRLIQKNPLIPRSFTILFVSNLGKLMSLVNVIDAKKVVG